MATKKDNIRFTISVNQETNDILEELSQMSNKKKNDIVVECLTQYLPLTKKLFEMMYSNDTEKQVSMLKNLLQFTANGLEQEDNKQMIKKEYENINKSKSLTNSKIKTKK